MVIAFWRFIDISAGAGSIEGASDMGVSAMGVSCLGVNDAVAAGGFMKLGGSRPDMTAVE